jgi:hypothetical protein
MERPVKADKQTVRVLASTRHHRHEQSRLESDNGEEQTGPFPLSPELYQSKSRETEAHIHKPRMGKA